MPIDKAGRFTYQKQYSRWDVMQAQRQFHAQASQQYMSNASDALSAIQTAFSNQITGDRAQAHPDRDRACPAGGPGHRYLDLSSGLTELRSHSQANVNRRM